MPVVTHRLIVEERTFGKETGVAYLRATAETWAARLPQDETLSAGLTGGDPVVMVAEVDAAGRCVSSGLPFPSDGRCFGEAERCGRHVRATWPGEIGRGQARARKLLRLEILAYVGSFVLFLMGLFALLWEVRRVRKSVRDQVEYVAGVSHRLKTPLTSISLCAELAKSGRLDASRQEESKQTIIDEAAKLNEIVDEVLAHVKEMRRG